MVEAARVTALATERSLHRGVDVWTLSRPLVDLPARHVLASHGPLVLSDGPDAFRRVSRQLRGGPGHAARRRSIRQRSSGIHTAASSPAHNSLARARASSRSVFARACVIPVSSGLTTTTRFTCGSRIRATSQQLPVTSNATRSDGSELSANVPRPSGVLGTRPAERTCPSSQIATTQRSRSTSKPIARPTHLTKAIPTPPPTWLTVSGRTSGTTTQTDTSSKLNPGKSRGRPNEKHGLEAHRSNYGLPVCVLPRSPSRTSANATMLSRRPAAPSRRCARGRRRPGTGQPQRSEPESTAQSWAGSREA
jgi:hypothetical protein